MKDLSYFSQMNYSQSEIKYFKKLVFSLHFFVLATWGCLKLGALRKSTPTPSLLRHCPGRVPEYGIPYSSEVHVVCTDRHIHVPLFARTYGVWVRIRGTFTNVSDVDVEVVLLPFLSVKDLTVDREGGVVHEGIGM